MNSDQKSTEDELIVLRLIGGMSDISNKHKILERFQAHNTNLEAGLVFLQQLELIQKLLRR